MFTPSRRYTAPLEALKPHRSFTLMGTSRIDPGNGTARATNSIPMPALELASSKSGGTSARQEHRPGHGKRMEGCAANAPCRVALRTG